MARTFAVLGIVAIVAAIALVMGVGASRDTYTLRVIGNSSAGYDVHPDDKPLGNVYHVGFNRSVQWDFINQTDNNEGIRLRLGDWELGASNDCAVSFTSGGGPGNCEATLPNIPNGDTGTIVADPEAPASDANNPFSFNLYIGRTPDGQMRRVDPELQIDDFNFDMRFTVPALVGAILLFLAWRFRRRARR